MPPGLIVEGLLLKTLITGVVPDGGVINDDGGCTVIQLGMRINSSSSDKERKTNLFNVVTSNNILPATATRP